MAVALRPYQEAALTAVMAALRKEPWALLQAATGAGKCLAPGTPVLLYDGTVKPVESIVVGDLLMGPDSRPRKVVSLASGTEQMYKVVPIKGEPFTVNESHILSLRITGLAKGAVTAPDGRRYRAGDVVDISVADYLTSSKTFKHVAKGFRSGRVEFASSKMRLPIPPYILGVWIGDGNSRGPEICNVDSEVIGLWHKYAASIHHECRSINIPGKAPLYRINAPAGSLKGRGHKANILRKGLKDLGLLENKHIPQDYKTSSVQNRLALLAGVIDTDGVLEKNCYDLCVKQKRLAEDVAFIARSLGLAAYVKPTMKTCVNTGATGEYWRVSISGHVDSIPCRVKRRQAGIRLQKKNVLHFGFSVHPIGEGQYYGFELEGPDRHFLLGDFTVTHNTIMFSELIRRWLTAHPGLRIGIVAHRQELITQARDKLVKVWPEGQTKIGLACASLGFVETHAPIIIGSVQTLARRLLKKPINLLIIDEAHRVPPQNIHSQYGQLIKRLRAGYPALRVLGVTATPFRLGHGYIYGDQCRKVNQNFFPRLDYRIGLNTLIAGGFLVPIRAKEAVDMTRELATVTLSGGDYNLGALGDLMGRTVHLESAVRALADHGEGRRHALVFAVSIDHAERLTRLFQGGGYRAAVVHSQMPNRERTSTLKRFDRGELDVLVNVGILTEGWDSPAVDIILLCRPTKSPALFVQMVGRGTRLAPGKENLLVLDLAGNFREHGDPDAPYVTWQDGASTGDPLVKICGRCGAVAAAAKRVCPECGHPFPVPERDENNDPISLKEIKFGPPGSCRLESWRAQKYRSARGNIMLRLDLLCRPGGLVHHYLDIEGANPYSHYKTQYWWWNMSGGQNPPRTVDEAVSRLDELRLPEKIVLLKNKDKKYQKVQGW